MDVLNVVSHILLSAGHKVIDRRFKIVACKVIIGGFCALWMVSWSRMDNPAAAEIWIRHDQIVFFGRLSSLKQIAFQNFFFYDT